MSSSLTPLHLLRALLREASYLPDATARRYVRRYVVARFKAYQPRHHATASFDVHAVARYRHQSFKRRQAAVIHERTRPLLRKGLKGLNFLRRANQGEVPCLQKVLFVAYGRLGRRKYALLDQLLRPDPAMDGDADAVPAIDAPSPLQQLYHSNKRYLRFFDAPKASSKTHHTISISARYSRLRAVLASQAQKGISIHRELKGAALKTPIHNVWERPMPIKRARNNVRRWYAETMTRLLPPLPNHEWDHLHAMVSKEKHIGFAKPRKPARLLHGHPPTQGESFTASLKEQLALNKPSRADKPAGMQRPHVINVKFMRRLYARLLVLCCKLEYDQPHRSWKAVWGEPQKSISPKIYNLPTDESFFAGVDAAGQLPTAPKPSASGIGPPNQLRPAKGDYVRFPFFTEYLPKTHPMRKELDDWKRRRAAVSGSASGR
ncbi:hypothetical protein BKA66DRAFT_434664 [Pyrenochaeta sp. MPI-SDFR-AT-0127]|nr:hypothetical protein BKA66DRAFT_434664 [Pyrenochaeta sp. MPI-SDFR-AT-0127]